MLVTGAATVPPAAEGSGGAARRRRGGRLLSPPPSSRALLLLVALAALPARLLHRALAGPDHTPLPYCADLVGSLSPEQRRTASAAVQAMQALDSFMGQLGLQQPPLLPLPPLGNTPLLINALGGWRAANATLLLDVLRGAGVAGRFGGSVEAAAAVALTCMSGRLRPDGFAGRPMVSLLLQYFKHPTTVQSMTRALHRTCESGSVPCELVVNVDNPHEAAAWEAEAAERRFLVPVFSYNVHEARAYNRAARLARGRVVVIWQDDNMPSQQQPAGSSHWMHDMLKVYDAHPRVGVLGLHKYRLCRQREWNNREGTTTWNPDPATGVRWSYAHFVDFAPMSLRMSTWVDVGGLEEGFTLRGDCGITGDWEVCTRAWLSGWEVGYMFLDGRRDVVMGGTHTSAGVEACWHRQMHVGGTVSHMRHGNKRVQEEMCQRVWLLNMLHFTAPTVTDCPYKQQWNYTYLANCSAPPAEVLKALLWPSR